jgi:ribosomal-protein-alanine N-acetyltransferase
MKLFSFQPFPTLSSKRLILRELADADAGALYALRSDKQVNKYLDRPPTQKIDDALAFIFKITNSIQQNKCVYWALTLKDNPLLIGTICLWNFSDNQSTAEIGYELNPRFQGQGLTNEAVSIVAGFGFKTMRLTAIEAYTHQANISSVRVLEKQGFKLHTSRKDEQNSDLQVYIKTKS